MPSHLQQIQLTYDLVDDRLLLTFLTTDFLEYRFWITRRLLNKFWALLQQVHQLLPANEEQKKSDAEDAEKSVKQELQSSEANKYSTRMSKCPLGDEPLLLCKISATMEKDRAHLKLEDIQGKLIDFTGDDLLVSLLIQLILRVLPKTDWGLKLDTL